MNVGNELQVVSEPQCPANSMISFCDNISSDSSTEKAGRRNTRLRTTRESTQKR